MLHHFLVPYQITLKCKDYEIDKADEISIEDILKEYFTRKEKRSIVSEKYLFLDEFTPFDKHICHGTMKAGEFGFEAELTDIETGKIKAKQTTHDAQTMPFFFQVKCVSRRKAILVIQKIGTLGIKTAFDNDINTFCSSRHQDYSIHFFLQTKKEVAEKFFKESVVKSICFKTKTVPEELENSLDKEDKKAFRADIRITKPSIVKKLYPNIEKWKTYNGSPIDKTQVKTMLGSRTATFTLGNISNTDIALVLPERIISSKTGHPYPQKILEESSNLIEDMSKD